MERQQLIKEIEILIERIKMNVSADVNSLLADVTRLYEMVVLLKHFPEEIQTNTESIPPPTVIPKEEKVLEKSQMSRDLFSEEAISAPVQKEIPDTVKTETPPAAPKKETLKEPAKNKTKESVSEKLQYNKIADLKAAIGINEKFQFINELFDGNMKEYTVAIDQINNFSSFSEAETYLANLKEMYKWDTENAVALNFEELVQRRLS